MAMSLDAFKTSNANFNDSVANIINASRAINEARDQERRALLERAKFATFIGDKDVRNEALTQLRNGNGVAGFLKNIFGEEKGANPVENTVGLDMSGDSYKPTPVQLEQRKQLFNGANAEQGGILSELKANFTDSKGRLDKKGWEEQLKSMGVTSSTVKKDINEYKGLQREQVKADKIVDKKNAEIIKKAEAEAMANYRKNPDAYYRDVLKRSGLYVTKFTGDKANMIAQNQRMYETLIQAAIDIGDYKRAERFNREYKANLASIDKNWGDDRGGKYDDLFDIRDYIGKAKGEKWVDVPVQRKLRGSSTIEAYVNNERIPESVYRKGKPAIQKYLAERDPHSYGGNVIEYIATPKGDQTTGAQKESREIDEKNSYYAERLEIGNQLVAEGKATGDALKISEGEKAIKEAQAYFGR